MCPYVNLEKERQLGEWANLTTPQTGSGSLELQEGRRAESGEGSAPATTWTLVTANRVGKGYLSTCLCQLHLGPAEGQSWNLTILEPHLPSLNLGHLPEPQFPQL